MKRALPFLFMCLAAWSLAAPLPAHAGSQAEAKELARNFNCTVSGITPLTIETGSADSTTYKVSCLLPATASDEDKKNNGTLTIRCDAALCRLLRKGE